MFQVNRTLMVSALLVTVFMTSAVALAQANSQIGQVVQRLDDLGFFGFFLPFFFTAAIFYGLLRKSRIFGDPESNVAVNAIVALTAGFMVWAYPILNGVPIQEVLSKFFFQGAIAMLAVMIGLLIAGMFMPSDLPSEISKIVKTGKGLGVIIGGGIVVVLVVVVTSGVGGLFLPGGIGGLNLSIGGVDSTTLLSGITIIAMAAAVIGIAWGGGGGSKK